MNKLLALCAVTGICVQAQYTISTLSDSHRRTGVLATQSYISDQLYYAQPAWDPTGGFYFGTPTRIVHVNQSGIIDKVIGGETYESAGDGLPATSAGVSVNPAAMAVDNGGNLYFIQYPSPRVRKIDAATGIISAVTGSGSPSATNGDGGPATLADVIPVAIGVDASGNLYLAEYQDVRKITVSTGIISTIAGTRTAGPSGDGGPALAANFASLNGIALDAAGNIYLADNNRIRKITASTNIISTIAGNGMSTDTGDGGLAKDATLNRTYGMGSDAAGNIYVSTYTAIRKISNTGIISTVVSEGNIGSYSGDGGPASNGTITPYGPLAVSASGDLLYGDSLNGIMIKIDSATRTLHIAAGSIAGIGDNGPLSAAAFNFVTRMTFDSLGNLYLADLGTSRVRKVSAATGTVTTVAGNGTRGQVVDGALATNTGIASGFSSTPSMALAIDSTGNLYFSDLWKIKKIDAATGILSTLVDLNPAGTSAAFVLIMDMVVDGGRLYIVLRPFSSAQAQLAKVDLATGNVTSILSISGLQYGAGLPDAMDRDSSGNFFYFTEDGALHKLDASSNAGSVIVPAHTCNADCPGPDSTGAQLGDGGPASSAILIGVRGLKADKNGNIFIADTNDARVRYISAATGNISTIAGATGAGCPAATGPASGTKLRTPWSLALAPDSSVYLFDHVCGQLNKLTPEPKYTGYVDSVSCTGVSGWAADQNRPSQSISIKIYDGNALLATVLADQERTDVGALLNDNGTHGFSYIFPPSIRDGNAHVIHLEYESTSSELPGSPRALTCPSGTNYAGFVDSASCSGGIKGWIADRNRPGIPILVSLFAGSTQISTTSAGQLRSDVGAYLNDDGLHGFSITIPPAYTAAPGQPLEVRYELSSAVVPGGSVTINCGASTAPKYAGFIDAASCAGVRGWVADRNRPNTPIVVSLWDGAFMIASTTASSLRSDVGAFLSDDGRHAFSLPIPSVALNGIAHALQIRYETSATQVPGAQANITCASTASYAGWVDSASCSGITGWAADKNRLNTPITVSLWDGATQIFSTTANASRPDVGAAIGDAGLHGFSMSIPGLYLDNVRHTYQIRYEQSNAQLPGSPAMLTCAQTAVYTGSVDVMSCSTISGWAADRNALNTSLDITVYEGASPLAIVSASGSRPDVGTFLGDNGLHGFGVPTPPVIKDGAPHTITVYPGNSHTPLYGPQALTCNP